MSYRIVQHYETKMVRRVLAPWHRKVTVGRPMMRGGGVTGMGFSLRPPKWLRKAQPGKILRKVALPVAAIGAALLIPGVGTAVGGALTSAAKGAGSLARLLPKGFSSLTKGVTSISKQFSPITTLAKQASPVLQLLPGIPGIQQGGSPSTPTVIPFESPAPAYVSPGGGGSYSARQTDAAPTESAPAAAAGEMPGWVIPVAIGAAVLLFARRK